MKIDERWLTSACIVSALLGILAISFFISIEQPSRVRISEITERLVDKKIQVNGVINSPSFSNGNYFFTLTDDSEMRVVAFEADIRKNKIDTKKIKDNETVSIEGTVQIYRGNIEIIAKEIS